MALALLLQLVTNAVYAASIYALLGLSWALIFNTCRVFHIAHGAVYAAGAYLLYSLHIGAHLPMLLAVPISLAGCACLGVILEIGLYAPLRRRQSTSMVVFVASLGAMTVLTAVLTQLYGPNVLATWNGPVYTYRPLGLIALTDLQVVAIAVGAATLIAFAGFWTQTWNGRALRALTTNPVMTSIVGIDTNRARISAMAIGSAIAGAAGILVSINEAASPTMIFNGVVFATAAATVGGFGSVGGAAVGGVLIALVANIGMWRLSAQWQTALIFAMLMFFLMVRPQGIFGERQRIAQV